MSSPSSLTVKRGEIWLVNFDPTVGREIQKTRPAVVISSDAVGRLPIKLVAPLTDWKDYFTPNIWHVRIDPDNYNGLAKVSAVDTLQLRGMDRQRFIRKLGQVSPTTIGGDCLGDRRHRRIPLARRSAGRVSDKVLFRDQFESRQINWRYHPAVGAVPGGSGDQVAISHEGTILSC